MSALESPARIDFESEVQTALEAAADDENHVERDPEVFHPSHLVRCPRRAYCSKFGLDDQREILGVFQTGTLIHEFLETQLGERFAADSVAFEEDIEYTDDRGITITGRSDCIDRRAGVVYDVKTRGGWYNFDPPTQRHLDQLYLYMAGLEGVEHGQIVYLSKKDMEVRTWPDNDLFEFDSERYDELIEKAVRLRDAIEAHGIADSAADIPFERCDCYFCSQEALRFDRGGDDE